MDEQGITNGIKAGGLLHDKALSYLYSNSKYRLPVTSFMRNKGLSQTESDTLWTDLVIQFGKLVISEKYDSQGTLVGYLMNLARYMVLNHFRDNKNHRHLELNDEIYNRGALDELNIYNDEVKSMLSKQLDGIGAMCKQILLLWSRNYSMAEIMTKLKIVSPEATRKRKHSCLKKLLDSVSKDELLQKQLKDYLYN